MQEFRCGGTHLQNFPHALQRMVRTVAPCVGRTLRGVQGPFGLDTFAFEALALSYRCEERLEGEDRAKALFTADEGYLRAVYGAFLAAAEMGGAVRRLDREGLLCVAGHRSERHVDRLAYARFIRRSRARARLRWLKNIWTVEEWVDYLLAKIERHHGITIVLSPQELRHPVITAIRYYFRLRHERRLH